MKRKTLCFIVAVSLMISIFQISSVYANSCPDYNSVMAAPAAPNPAKRNFRNFANTLLSWAHSPYHMVHDQIVRVGSGATMVGKFDYDRVMHKDLEYEYIHVYMYGTGYNSWQYLGKYKTDWDGKIYVQVPPKQEGDYIIRMVVEGDRSVATGYLTVVQPGRKTVLFDIDGTLTLNDNEIIKEYIYLDNAEPYPYAVDMVQAYINKGYQVVFLTGRPYWTATLTRSWFDRYDLFPWQLRMNSSADWLLNVQQYKTDYLNYLQRTVGLDIIRAYGNDDTDIAAYTASGISTNNIYMIGDMAGQSGTQPIYNNYYDHLYTVVQNTPASDCTLP
jgi:phosphatidate phosphatase PAH1